MRSRVASPEDAGVVIRIRFDAHDPPTGEAAVEGQTAVAFVGWLGLLRVLSELLGLPRR
jgi:hypothetical protein